MVVFWCEGSEDMKVVCIKFKTPEEVQAAYGVDLRHVSPGSELYADLRALFQQLHIVDNNSNATRGGGGTPRRPPAPPICGAP